MSGWTRQWRQACRAGEGAGPRVAAILKDRFWVAVAGVKRVGGGWAAAVAT